MTRGAWSETSTDQLSLATDFRDCLNLPLLQRTVSTCATARASAKNIEGYVGLPAETGIPDTKNVKIQRNAKEAKRIG